MNKKQLISMWCAIRLTMNQKKITTSIKIATITAVIIGAFNLFAGVAFSNTSLYTPIQLKMQVNYRLYYSINAFVFLVCAAGISKNSRFFAIGAFVWSIVLFTQKAIAVYTGQYYGYVVPSQTLNIILYAVIIALLFLGVWGTIVYHYQNDMQNGVCNE